MDDLEASMRDMDPEIMDKRVACADSAIQGFARACGMADASGTPSEQGQTILGDLICDLMHWCDATGVDWGAAVLAGENHWSCEVDDA